MRGFLRGVLFACFLTVFAFGWAKDSTDYVLGPEDLITITVLRHPEFSGDFLVPDSEVINVPVAGNVDVTGMTTAKLAALLTKQFKRRLLKPEVNVSLKIPRMQRIYVLGNVQRPGVLDLKPMWRAAEAISAAGGVDPLVQKDDVKVTLERPGSNPVVARLDDALSGQADNFKLHPGDVLRVDALPLTMVYVTGSVMHPGLVPVRDDLRTVLSAISQAGGPTPDAAISSVKIVHSNGTQETVDLSLYLVRPPTENASVGGSVSKISDAPIPLLSPGDMVIVPQSLDKVAVLGFVGRPGFYPIPDGQRINLVQVIALASGASDSVNNRAKLSKVGLVRQVNGKDVRMVYDLTKYFKKGDVTQNPEIYAGDIVYVPESGRVEVTTALTGLSVAGIFLNLLRP